MPNPEFPPLQDNRPVMTVSQRKQYLDELRFIETRNLAFLQYKKPDQSPLMTYEETLNDRELVKRTVLAFELSQGWLIPDGTDLSQPTTAAPQVQPAVPQGAPQMTQPFQPPMPAQQQMPFAAPPQPMGQAPVQQPPQMFAQPQVQQQPMAPQQTFAAPQVASPQQAAAVGQPPQQEAPAAAPTGRKRRGAAGTSVAPPPAAPPQQPQGQVPVQQFAAPQQFAQAPGAPAPFAPAPQQSFAPGPQMGAPAPFAPPPQQQVQAQVPQQQAVTQQTAAVDLSAITGRLDAIGKLNEKLGADLLATQKELADLKNTNLLGLAVLHHLYLSNGSLNTPERKVPTTLPEFQAYLQQFVGPR